MDVFPSDSRVATFSVYDDDGHTYAYEKDKYFQQDVTAKRYGEVTKLTISRSRGSYQTTIPA